MSHRERPRRSLISHKDILMTSPARAAANAANAQLSTGPRTEAGKSNSSRNALKHGLASEQNFIAPGEEEEFAELFESLIETLAPTNGVEMLQVETALHAAWSLRRFRTVEATLMEGDIEALFDEHTAKTLDRLQRYGAHHQRMFDSALKVLRLMRTSPLAHRAAAGNDDPVPCAVSVALARQNGQYAKRTHPRPAAARAAASSTMADDVDAPISRELQNEPIARAAASGQEAA
jgi:hypothetical protein